MILSGPFILRPIATSLLMIALFFSGLLAYRLLPISALPEVDYPTIQISTFYPGASPDVVASSITAPLERQFGQMSGLNQMSSSSSSGASIITLQFSLTTTLDIAEQEVQAAINAAATFLPQDLPNPPIYNKVNPADTPIVTLALTSNVLPLAQVEDYADTRLVPKISQVAGVGLVTISGGQKPAVRIQVNSNALAAYGLTLEDIRNVVATNNVNFPKGSFDGPQQAFTINANDQLLTSAMYRPLIIAYKNASPVRLQDIAQVIDSVENVRQAAWMNTAPAVIVNVQRQPGANIIETVDRIKQLLPQLRANIPAEIHISLLSDRTLAVRASVSDAQFELLFAVALVVLVIFLFLRNLPATFIPSIAVPLSLIGSLGVMYLLGYSLNNLTLMALIIATGFVVDDAIVMIENIARYIEKGEPPLIAALQGAKQIGFTIVSLTISLIAVLIPLLFMQDMLGRLFREFSITLAVTILLSAFISLTLTPMLCARMLRSKKSASAHAETSSEFAVKWMIARYATSLRYVLNHQGATLLIAVLTLLITIWLFYIIPKGFFPIQDVGIIQGISEATQSISFSAMAERQQALARIILEDPAVASLSSFIGIDGTNTTLNSGRMQINLKPLAERDASALEIIQRLQTKLAKVVGITLYLQPVQDITIDDRPSRAQYQYSLNSPHAETVVQWTKRMVDTLRTIPILKDVTSDQQNGGLYTEITIDRDTAARLGISVATLDNIFYDAFGQRQISTMFTQLNQYRVVLEVLPELKQSPQALNNIYINSVTGGAVPLSAITRVAQTTKPLVINRQGQFPVALISFNLMEHTSLGEAVTAIQQAKQEIGMPASIQTSFEGAAKVFQSALMNEWFLILAAILVMYIVLGVLYESYIHPITILSTLPSATMGALLALMLFDRFFSVIALIGIILLIGIVKKNAIMMIDFALDLERNENQPPREAIYNAALLRFRPILMTTLAALFAAIPLAFGTGMGAELRQPLGITIIGGLILSQLLTLYTTPVIYLAFDKLGRLVK